MRGANKPQCLPILAQMQSTATTIMMPLLRGGRDEVTSQEQNEPNWIGVFWVRLFPKPLGDLERVDLEILRPGWTFTAPG